MWLNSYCFGVFESLLLRQKSPGNLRIFWTFFRFDHNFDHNWEDMAWNRQDRMDAFLCIRYIFYECFHAVRRLSAHFLRYVAIHIQREAGCRVSEISLHGLDIVAAF